MCVGGGEGGAFDHLNYYEQKNENARKSTMNNGMLDLLQDDQLSHKMSSFHFILNSLYRVKLQKSDLQTALLIFLMLAGGPDVPFPLINKSLRIPCLVCNTTRSGRYKHDFCRNSSYHQMAVEKYLQSQQVWLET